jgi:hypothetical protein
MDIAAEFMAATINAFEANKRLADRAVEQVPDWDQARKESQLRAFGEGRAAVANSVSFIVFFPERILKPSPSLSPSFGDSTTLGSVCPGCRESSRIPPAAVFPGPCFPMAAALFCTYLGCRCSVWFLVWAGAVAVPPLSCAP